MSLLIRDLKNADGSIIDPTAKLEDQFIYGFLGERPKTKAIRKVFGEVRTTFTFTVHQATNCSIEVEYTSFCSRNDFTLPGIKAWECAGLFVCLNQVDISFVERGSLPHAIKGIMVRPMISVYKMSNELIKQFLKVTSNVLNF